MGDSWRSRRALLVVVLGLLCVAGLASATARAGHQAGPRASRVATILPGAVTIEGDPLWVVLGADSSIQIYHSQWPEFGQVYGWQDASADSGIWLWVGEEIYGPDYCFADRLITAMPAARPWTSTEHGRPVGAGTESDPWVVTTVLDAGTTGVRVTQRVFYVDGQDYCRLQWEISNSSGSEQTIDLFHAVDPYFVDDEAALGYYDEASGAVGGLHSASPWYMLFVPADGPATAYQEGFYADIWSGIGYCGDNVSCPVLGSCERGPGLNNTLGTDPEGTDDAFGLQWRRTIPAGGSMIVSDWWTFGTAPNIPGAQPTTPTPVATPSTTPTAVPSPEPTATPSPTLTATPVPRKGCYLPVLSRRVVRFLGSP